MVAAKGESQPDLSPLYAALQADLADELNAVLYRDNLPLEHETSTVVAELAAIRGRYSA